MKRGEQFDQSDQYLFVYLNEVYVGKIQRLPDDRTVFSFAPSYEEHQNRPLLSLSFKTANGGLIRDTQLYSQKLHPFFSNLLPEGHLRTYLSEKLEIKPQREFFLLAALGHDLPGAVRVEPSFDLAASTESDQSDASKLFDRAPIRFSLAGVQLKFSAILESRGRLTIPAKGQGGAWIVKLPAGNFDNVPDAEFAMMMLAQSAGLDVPESKLVPVSSIKGLPAEFASKLTKAFAVRRFDRDPQGKRIHIEDFAQIFGQYPHEKYDKRSYANIAEVLWVECGEGSLVEFVKRLVFNLAIGNGDMHLKNWSVLYADDRQPRLSPAYDLVPTIAFMPAQSLGLKLGGIRVFKDVELEHFKRLAAKARVPERVVTIAVREAVQSIKTAWRATRNDLPLSAYIVQTIEKHMKSLALFRP